MHPKQGETDKEATVGVLQGPGNSAMKIRSRFSAFMSELTLIPPLSRVIAKLSDELPLRQIAVLG